MYPYPMPGAPPQAGKPQPGANAVPGAPADPIKQATKLRADLGRAVDALRRSKLSGDMADLPLVRDLANSLGNLVGSPGNPEIAARVKRQADALAGQTKRTARNKIGGVDIQGAAQQAAALADQIAAAAVPTSERVNTAAEAQWLWEILSLLTKSGMLRSKAGSLQKAIEKGDPGTIARIDAEIGLLRVDTDAEAEVVAAMRSLTAPSEPPENQMGHDYARVAASEVVHLWKGDTIGFQGLKRGSRLTATFARAATRLWTLAQAPDDPAARAAAEQVAGELRQASEDNANSGEEQKTARQAAWTIDEALNPR